MQLKQQESGAALAGAITMPESKTSRAEFKKQSSSLPFGQPVPLSSITGPTYVTGQLLVQQVAYQLSDKIFSYSPETFDLDIAAKDWSRAEEENIHGYATTVLPLQTRSGAGAFALGYIFSEDFDLSKRHIPLSLLAPSLSLRQLRSSLDQLTLLYGVSSPFVAHVAAADFASNAGLVTEYASALQLSEELGLGLVASSSPYEAQHMSLFATLMAKILPTVHIYDGIRSSRETLRVIDVLGPVGVADAYNTVHKALGSISQRLDTTGRVMELLNAFNNHLGTEYDLFEYSGHETAETVFVVFGSVESQLAKQVVGQLAAKGVKVGAVSVRVYRPFAEEAFLNALPNSVRHIVVLGQVSDETAVADGCVSSVLHSDVMTAVSFSDKWTAEPTVVDVKYGVSEVFTPSIIASTILRFVSKEAIGPADVQLSQLVNAGQYIFLDVDDSTTLVVPHVVGTLLSKDSTSNVYVSETHDNQVQGGVVRTDLRISKKTIDMPYPIEQADVVIINDVRLLKRVASSRSVKDGGKLLLRLPNFKEEEVEKWLSAAIRKDIKDRDIELHILDSALSPAFEKDAAAARLLAALAFLGLAQPATKPEVLRRLATLDGNEVVLEECLDAIEKALHKLQVPDTWAEAADEAPASRLSSSLKTSSFVPFDKSEPELDLQTTHWQAAAQGLLFKEAYGTQTALRPDQPVKMYTVRVRENRRLTPSTYDRNIFHIEFDLGNSGLTYKIGEALGVHADNDPELVQQFIDWYGLKADELVQVPARDGETVEGRTTYQSLLQNVDIFGKPAKRFYESLASFATDELEKKKLVSLGGADGAEEFKRRAEVDTVTYADILEEFKSAHPSFADLVRLVGPLKRREYSIASAQAVTPNAVALMIVVVDWVDSRGRTRYGQATRYLSRLPLGAAVAVSVKPSVMKLPTRDDAPLIMAGLGTGLAPFRAFVQYRAMQKAEGKEIGSILLYLGSRHQREEYLYGEEWEAYMDAGVITLLGAAFSRDQPQKIYIQDRMRETMKSIVEAYITRGGSFYLCGPTWPVPDVTEVLQEAIATEARWSGRKVDSRKEIDRLKEEGRYVLEVY